MIDPISFFMIISIQSLGYVLMGLVFVFFAFEELDFISCIYESKEKVE